MDNKDLKALLKVMRQNGVTHYKTQELELSLSPEFLIAPEGKEVIDTTLTAEDKYGNFPDGELSPEQLAFYSAGGDPNEDPFRQDN